KCGKAAKKKIFKCIDIKDLFTTCTQCPQQYTLLYALVFTNQYRSDQYDQTGKYAKRCHKADNESNFIDDIAHYVQHGTQVNNGNIRKSLYQLLLKSCR